MRALLADDIVPAPEHHALVHLFDRWMRLLVAASDHFFENGHPHSSCW
jgi:hypothetical protein